VGTAFDQWFRNLFPRETPFVYNEGGYLTLSFIPTLGTMILGLIAGRWLRAAAPKVPIKPLLIAGVAGIAAGIFFHFTHICPVVKRIWTPSWTLFSGGACFLWLAGFSWVIEIKRYKAWALPPRRHRHEFHHGLLHRAFPGECTFRIHLGPRFFEFLGVGLEPLLEGAAVLSCYWHVLFWMYRRRLFLKI
jgi:heparan-alpha-glucosaminide N-acetyltransferase